MEPLWSNTVICKGQDPFQLDLHSVKQSQALVFQIMEVDIYIFFIVIVARISKDLQ